MPQPTSTRRSRAGTPRCCPRLEAVAAATRTMGPSRPTAPAEAWVTSEDAARTRAERRGRTPLRRTTASRMSQPRAPPAQREPEGEHQRRRGGRPAAGIGDPARAAWPGPRPARGRAPATARCGASVAAQRSRSAAAAAAAGRRRGRAPAGAAALGVARSAPAASRLRHGSTRAGPPGQPVGLPAGLERAQQPVRPPRPVGRVQDRGPGAGEPLLVRRRAFAVSTETSP